MQICVIDKAALISHSFFFSFPCARRDSIHDVINPSKLIIFSPFHSISQTIPISMLLRLFVMVLFVNQLSVQYFVILIRTYQPHFYFQYYDQNLSKLLFLSLPCFLINITMFISSSTVTLLFPHHNNNHYSSNLQSFNIHST